MEQAVQDTHVLLTQVLVPYVYAMRRFIAEGLQKALGEHWWTAGVLDVFDEARRHRLEKEVQSHPGRALELSLDVAHFPRIIDANLGSAFPHTFINRFDAFGRMRRIVHIRNQWAHQHEISFSMALRAAGWMKDVLIELKCTEALRIEELMKDHAIERTAFEGAHAMDNVEPPIDDDDLSLPDERETSNGSASLWHELRQYLKLEVHVDLPEEWDRGTATATVRVHNAAPANRDAPEVRFLDITVSPVGGGAPVKGSGNTSQLGPGDTHEAQFTFSPRQILSATFNVDAKIDMERYFRITSGAEMPEDVVEPIRREFIATWDAVNIKAFAVGIEADFTGFHEKMPMDELQSRSAALDCRIQELQEKQESLSELYSHFRLRDTAPLARRVKELVAEMRALEKRLNELKGAVGSHDMEQIALAVESAKGVRLAVLRLETVVRSASGA